MAEYTELILALRHCMTKEDGITICEPCPFYCTGIDCENVLHTDAAAAIEALEAENKTLHQHIEDLNGAFRIESEARQKAEAGQPHWVSVEEPPKEHGPFLCASKSTMLDGSTHWFFELCWYSDGDLKDVVWDAEKDSGFYSWSASQDRDIDSKVDYWMPLPEPPQEG